MDILKKLLDHYHKTYPQSRYRIAPQESEYIRVESLYEKLENDEEISSSKEEGKYNGLKKQLSQLSKKGYVEIEE